MKFNRTDWLVIIGALLLIGLSTWWPKPPPAQRRDSTDPVQSAPGEIKKDEATKPAAAAPPVTTPSAEAKPEAKTAPANLPEEKVVLKNDEVTYTFTTKGGGIASAEMINTKDHVLLNSRGKAAMGALSQGLNQVDDLDYRIASQSAGSVVFEAETPEHLVIRKEFSLTEGAGGSPNLLDFSISFTNKGADKVARENLFLYTGAAHSLRPDEIVKPGFCWNDAGDPDYKDTNYFGSHWFGADTTDFQKSLDRMRWAGVMSRFYAQLICTKEDQRGSIWSTPFPVDHSQDEFKDMSGASTDRAIHGGLGLPKLELGAGETKRFDLRVYLGPKIFHDLKRIDSVDPDRQVRYVMFFGKFSWVSRFMVYWLRNFHDWFFSSWGAAIILLTIFVRSALWPLQARANAQFKRMGLLGPKMKELQAKFQDNPQKYQQETMKLYREHGVNPLGGCVPMLIQLPIFIGFYSALQVAAELRGQTFFWIRDLSMPDTVGHLAGFAVNPLPLIMVATNVLQMKLTPQPPSVDKSQQRMMMFMPVIFLAICYNFAAALALYMTTTNVFMIVQAQIQRRFGKDVVLGPPRQLSTSPSPQTPQPPFGAANKKKDKPGPPRLGGGGTRSTRKQD